MLSSTLKLSHLYTSEAVLTELMNYFCHGGSYLRERVVRFVKEIETNPLVTVFPQTPPLYHAGKKLYHQALDKHWSHTDCMSFVLMRQKKMTEALTYDKHFEQAGFVALLRGD